MRTRELAKTIRKRQKPPQRRVSSKSGQETSSDRMLNHQDGGMGDVIHDNGESNPPSSKPKPKHVGGVYGSINSWRPQQVKKRHMLIFAFVVFFGQILISVTLKRYGWIEKDFNEIVAEHVVPTIQEHAEQLVETGSKIIQEQLLFNESTYWLNLDQALGQRTQERHRPGLHLKQKGAEKLHPVIMIPGFVTSGLEVWDGKECAKRYFRQRLWGGVGSVQKWLMDRRCAIEHMKLDPFTGTDPEGIRMRAAQGFEAADFFLANYWVWNPIIENLADIGYDAGMMSIEAYDWRLAFPKLEERDGYLTKLKYKIEAFHKSSGKKTIVASHSMGGVLVNYFFTWVTTSEKNGGGGGGKGWVDKHVHAYVNIAGPHLGVIKATSALLSGEMSDTILLGPTVEQFIGRKLRRDLWMSWGSLWSMLPVAGEKLWDIGADLRKRINEKDKNELEGESAECRTHGFNEREDSMETSFLVMTRSDEDSNNKDGSMSIENNAIDDETERFINEKIAEFSSSKGLTTHEVVDFLLAWGGGLGPMVSGAQLHSFDPKSKQTKDSWFDVSRTPLPVAPNMKVYCFYGVGLNTERSYFYKRNEDSTAIDAHETPFILDTSFEDPENFVLHGVKYADGDGSVPLLSLGYMCADAWRRPDSGLNPSKIPITTKEYKHSQEFTVDDPMRGGPGSADHVDILGNFDMMEDFLKIVAGFEQETVKDQFESDILKISKEVNAHPGGGLYKRKRSPFKR